MSRCRSGDLGIAVQKEIVGHIPALIFRVTCAHGGIIPSDVHMIPSIIQLHNIPDVVHGITAGIVTVDANAGQKVLICHRVALTDCAAAYQRVIGSMPLKSIVIRHLLGQIVVKNQCFLGIRHGIIHAAQRISYGFLIRKNIGLCDIGAIAGSQGIYNALCITVGDPVSCQDIIHTGVFVQYFPIQGFYFGHRNHVLRQINGFLIALQARHNGSLRTGPVKAFRTEQRNAVINAQAAKLYGKPVQAARRRFKGRLFRCRLFSSRFCFLRQGAVGFRLHDLCSGIVFLRSGGGCKRHGHCHAENQQKGK